MFYYAVDSTLAPGFALEATTKSLPLDACRDLIDTEKE
jgi:hypothetical protein